MPEPATNELLRDGLLDGRSLLVAHAPSQQDGYAPAVEAVCGALGAAVAGCEVPLGASEPETAQAAVEAGVADALTLLGEIDTLIVDSAGFCDAATSLLDCMEASWSITRAVANAAFIERGRDGRIVLLAPAPHASSAVAAHLEPTRAGLENLARTLSIEWARYAITTVAIAPSSTTDARQLATLCAYLASPAGAYFSGCQLDLRGPGPR